MPVYEYQCVDCKTRDRRVAAVDDHTAFCVSCGSLMLRLDEDVFEPYFPPTKFRKEATMKKNSFKQEVK